MYQVEVTFGHCCPNGELLPAHKIAASEQRAIRVVSRRFGGGRLERQTGGYLTAEGRLVIEPCTVVWAYVPRADAHLALLHDLASEIAVAPDQEYVLLVVMRVDCTVNWVQSVRPSIARDRGTIPHSGNRLPVGLLA